MGRRMARCRSIIRRFPTPGICAWRQAMLDRAAKGFRGIGRRVVNGVWRLGYASRFFLLTLVYSGTTFRRLHLAIKEDRKSTRLNSSHQKSSYAAFYLKK